MWSKDVAFLELCKWLFSNLEVKIIVFFFVFIHLLYYRYFITYTSFRCVTIPTELRISKVLLAGSMYVFVYMICYKI
jgi:hypothetical protein